MIQPSYPPIYISLVLAFIINLDVFDFVYDHIIFKENRFIKWKFSWSTVFRLILRVAFVAMIFTFIFHWQYSKTTALTNSESWLSALNVAWTHLVLVFPIALLLIFVITCVVTICVIIFQIRFLDGLLKKSSNLEQTRENYEIMAILQLPFMKAPKSRLWVLPLLFPNFPFNCGSAFLLGWVFLDIGVASLIAFPITFWLLKMLFISTIDLQMILFGVFDPTLGWQDPSKFGFSLLSSHIMAIANWLRQQPIISSILGFLGLIITAIISLATIKKAIEDLRDKTGKPKK